MARAQRRDAARSGKFYFRKDVLPPGHTTLTSSPPSCSGLSSPVEGTPVKEKLLRNCFPPVPRPPYVEDASIKDEYEEMTVEEIFIGKVVMYSLPAAFES